MPVATTALSILPFGGPCGAEVKGVDMRAPLAPEVAAEIGRALLDHLVLVFRGEKPMSEAEQIEFTRRLGPIETRDGAPITRLVANVAPPGVTLKFNERHDTEMFFHHDTCFAALPQKALALHALEVPPVGGNTLFANMHAAYDALPARLKERIAGLRALHVFIYTKTERADIYQGYDKLLHATHPVAIRHPETGRRALYVNRLMTMRIEGMAAGESDALLAELFAHAERPEFQYEHRWRRGDLVLWDNLATMHARTEMPSAEPRIMRHTSLRGVAAPLP
jgi:taurine dioxygenase